MGVSVFVHIYGGTILLGRLCGVERDGATFLFHRLCGLRERNVRVNLATVNNIVGSILSRYTRDTYRYQMTYADHGRFLCP